MLGDRPDTCVQLAPRLRVKNGRALFGDQRMVLPSAETATVPPPSLRFGGSLAEGAQVAPPSVENDMRLAVEPCPRYPTRTTNVGLRSAKSRPVSEPKIGLVDMPPGGETVRLSCRNPPRSYIALISGAPLGGLIR